MHSPPTRVAGEVHEVHALEPAPLHVRQEGLQTLFYKN